MRPTFRAAFAALLAVLAVSAVGSASASAAECKHTAGSTTFCIENKPVTGEVPFTASSHTAILEWEGIEIQCVMADNGTFHPAGGETIGVTNRVIELSQCKVATPAHCATKPIVLGKEGGASGLIGEVSLSGGAFQLNALPAKGSAFGTVTFINNGGSCIIAGTLSVTSSSAGKGPICSLPGVTSEAVEHKLKCQASNTHLKLGEETLTLEVEETVALAGAYKGEKWSLWEA